MLYLLYTALLDSLCRQVWWQAGRQGGHGARPRVKAVHRLQLLRRDVKDGDGAIVAANRHLSI